MSKRRDHTTDNLFQSPQHESWDNDQDAENEEGFSLADALDIDILMHRDAHFGGQFPIMIDYYLKEGKGTNPEFEIPRLEMLHKQEAESGENLAGILLTGADAERIGRAREAYRKLRDIVEARKGKPTHAQVLADMILSEDAELTEEMDAVVAAGPDIVPALIQLIQSDDYYDPLFPGYGLAPTYAAHCLGKLGDERAVTVLFENIGQGDFFNEDTLCQALHEIGAPAKKFLLKVMQSRPVTDDNECAALALSYFANDPEVAHACLTQLQDEGVKKTGLLATYLVLGCLGLKEAAERKAFTDLVHHKDFPAELRRDADAVIAQWKH